MLGQLSYPAFLSLLLAAFIHRKNLRNVFARMFPEGTAVNFLVFLIDALLITAPLAVLSAEASRWLKGAGLVVPLGGMSLPVWATLFLAVFLGDGVAYWRHRLEHSRFLWPSHLLHHSDRGMSWMTTFRFHPINRLTTTIIDSGALVVLGFPAWAIAINGLVRHNWGLFVHLNVPWTLGPVGRVLVSPAMHRWHHVRSGPGVSCNFAAIFTVFDRAFGTYYAPGPCDQPLGVEGMDDRDFLKQLLMPAIASWGWARARARTALKPASELR